MEPRVRLHRLDDGMRAAVRPCPPPLDRAAVAAAAAPPPMREELSAPTAQSPYVRDSTSSDRTSAAKSRRSGFGGLLSAPRLVCAHARIIRHWLCPPRTVITMNQVGQQIPGHAGDQHRGERLLFHLVHDRAAARFDVACGIVVVLTYLPTLAPTRLPRLALSRLAVHALLRKLAKLFVCALFLLEDSVQDTRVVGQSKLACPGCERAVNSDLVVLDALGRRNDAGIATVAVGHHLCPTLPLAKNGLHRAVLVLSGVGIVFLQKLIQPISPRLRLRVVELQSATQTRVFHQLNYLRQRLNELVLHTAQLLKLDHVHSAKIVDVHCNLRRSLKVRPLPTF